MGTAKKKTLCARGIGLSPLALVCGDFVDSSQIESGHNTRQIESGDNSRNRDCENAAFCARGIGLSPLARLNLDTIREVGTAKKKTLCARGIGLSPLALVSGM